MKILRLIAAYFDNMLLALACAPLFLWWMDHRSVSTSLVIVFVYVILSVLKDIPIFSFGKKLFRFDVYRVDNMERASVLQRILRNITLPIWPLELIVFLFSSDNRRLSDKLCRTIVKHKNDV